ncbi:MAG: uncharacterized protein KVP18_000125 [Porospora cf. gigantea A]|uniref:uncharacterized protein n=1 Tax=Porospora cf. gigantea A TaxID=2853593 RepID=UPI00355A4D54|nr:MAG: hypothetical protein KVP18_000125 [Porospora cf. gigantea A]
METLSHRSSRNKDNASPGSTTAGARTTRHERKEVRESKSRNRRRDRKKRESKDDGDREHRPKSTLQPPTTFVEYSTSGDISAFSAGYQNLGDLLIDHDEQCGGLNSIYDEPGPYTRDRHHRHSAAYQDAIQERESVMRKSLVSLGLADFSSC